MNPEPTYKKTHFFPIKSEYFLPALLKFNPNPQTLKFGLIATETVPTKLIINSEKKKIILEKFKKTRNFYFLKKFSKEKLIFDFEKKKLNFFENDFKKKNFSEIFFDIEKNSYEKKIFGNLRTKGRFDGFMDLLGDFRIFKEMRKFELDNSLVNDIIELNLD